MLSSRNVWISALESPCTLRIRIELFTLNCKNSCAFNLIHIFLMQHDVCMHVCPSINDKTTVSPCECFMQGCIAAMQEKYFHFNSNRVYRHVLRLPFVQNWGCFWTCMMFIWLFVEYYICNRFISESNHEQENEKNVSLQQFWNASLPKNAPRLQH